MKYENINKLVTNILVPIQLEKEYVLVLKQAVELAREHNAAIHLLYVESVSYNFRNRWIPKLLNQCSLNALLKEKSVLMGTWKRWIEHEYGIQSTCTVDWGNWKKIILRYEKTLHADMIVLKEQQSVKHWFPNIKISPTAYIIKKSNCQVITLFSKKDSIAEWSQIVIPVTGFIPVTRILTIIKSVKAFNIKIHLIASSANESVKVNPEFHFLTESLKCLKFYNNVQVECRYITNSIFPFFEYIKYAKSIGADALMTNNNGNVNLSQLT